MKNSIVLFLLVIFNVQITNGQTRNYDQELVDLLYAKQLKEAIDFYDQYKDSIYHSFTLDSYKLLTNIYLENQDSVFRQLPSFMEKYYGSVIDDDFVLFLPSFYSDKGDYANHLKMLEILESFYNQRREKIDKFLNELSKLKNYYPSSQLEIINKSGTEEVHIPVRTEPLLFIDVEYNGRPIQTVFDTGSSLPFLTDKKNADKAGIKVGEFSMNYFNGIERRSAVGWLDSVQIGSLLIKNVPVTVFEQDFAETVMPESNLVPFDNERKARGDSVLSRMQMVMGMPVILKLNHVRFVLPKKEMIVSLNRKNSGNGNSNIYLKNNLLYLESKINSADFTAFFDTGANLGKTAVIIGNRFYQAHKEKIPISSSNNEDLSKENSSTDGTKTSQLMVKPSSLLFSLNDKQIDFQQEAVILDANPELYLGDNDIFLTLEFLKKFENVTFDFHNMVFDGEINE